MNKHYYMGPYIPGGGAAPEDPLWKWPANTIGAIDIRGEAQPLGFFCTSQPILDQSYIPLNSGGVDLREYDTKLVHREALREELGLSLSQLPDSTRRLSDILFSIVCEQGDPEKGVRLYPATATHKGNLEMFLSGHGAGPIKRRKFIGEVDPAFIVLEKHIQNDVQRMVDAGTPSIIIGKYLSTLSSKYSILDVKKFQPLGMNIVAVEPTTTISDDFNRSNEDLTTGGNWDVQTGNVFDVILNAVQHTTLVPPAPETARNTNSLSTDDHYAQIDTVSQLTGSTLYVSAHTRLPASHLTGYYALARESGSLYNVVRMDAGSFGALIVDGSPWITSWPQTIRCIADGSTISATVNGAELISGTDTNYTGTLTAGFGTNAGAGESSVIDNYVSSDLLISHISITGNGNPIINGSSSPDISNDTNFEGVTVGEEKLVTYTVINSGIVDLTLTDSPAVVITGDAEFTLDTDADSPIAPAGNTTFKISYVPTAAEVNTATISIANNDDDEDPYTFDIAGTGIATSGALVTDLVTDLVQPLVV